MWFVENDYKYPLFFDNINSLPLRSCQRPTLPVQGDNIKPHPTPLLAVANFLCIKSSYLDTFIFKNFVNFPTKSCLANPWHMHIKRLKEVFQPILLAKMLVMLFCNECRIPGEPVRRTWVLPLPEAILEQRPPFLLARLLSFQNKKGVAIKIFRETGRRWGKIIVRCSVDSFENG